MLWIPVSVQGLLASFFLYKATGSLWYPLALVASIGAIAWCTDAIVRAIKETH